MSMASSAPRVWIVEADESSRSELRDFLGGRGCDVCSFEDVDQIFGSQAPSLSPSLLVVDLRTFASTDWKALEHLLRLDAEVPVIVLAEDHEFRTVKVPHAGRLWTHVPKPMDPQRMMRAMESVIGFANGHAPETASSASVAEEQPRWKGMLASSNPRMLRIRAICEKVARADVPVLILGESGVGKEVISRHIHDHSGREGPFLKINCAALPADLLESELFGHERGAFTGALREKPGKFEQAEGGTLLLDEIAEMSPLLQAKLLHVLQDGEYSRLGATHTTRSCARILAATNKPLESLVSKGEFREDLYFRLNVITIEVPPLRERPEDIPLLCRHFIEKYGAAYNSGMQRFPVELEAAFAGYSWPGNVRQLENAVKRFLILPDLRRALADAGVEAPEAAPGPVAVPDSVSLKELSAMAAERAEKELILRTLDEVAWNRKQAARRLNICYKSLLNKLHRWKLPSGTASGKGRTSNRRSYTGPCGDQI